jgi:hypothetical protein
VHQRRLGLGLANTHASQATGEAELKTESPADGGAVVTLVLPFRETK